MRYPVFTKMAAYCTAASSLFLALSTPVFGVSATLMSVDKATQGTWRGVYGSDGFSIPYQTAAFPAYAKVIFSGASQWVWNYATSDSPALQKPNGTDRIASCWYATSTYSIDINITDGQAHPLAMYFLDWDAMGRQQTVTVTDAVTGAVLDTHTLSGFAKGIWLSWSVHGHVIVTLKSLVGNAVAGGVFFGGAVASTPTPQAATPAITPAGGSFASSTTVTISTATVGAAIRYTTDGVTMPIATSALYTVPLTLTRSTTIKAKAFASGMTDSTVATATFTITAPTSPGNSAAFVMLDKTTQGNWRGVYGGDGGNIANQGGTYPAYATVNFSGSSQWVWNYNSMDIAALQKISGTDRIASCWYAPSSYSLDLNLTDGQTHRVAIYCLDWDAMGRQQTVTVSDPVTGAVLNVQILTDFKTGAWLVWNIQGHVQLTFRALSGNTVASALFFGGAGAVIAPPVLQVAAPVINPAGGTFSGPTPVTISSATPGATIYYTSDGSTPTASSPVYRAPLNPSVSVTIKAKAVAPSMTDSAVTTAVFNISNPAPPVSTLPDLASYANRVFPAPEGFNTVQYAPDGKLGFIVWRDQQLIFRERNAVGNWSEDIVDNAGNVFQMLLTFNYYGLREDYKFQPSAVLLYDLASQAHVFQASGHNVSHYTHGNGTWLLKETITDALASDNIAVLLGAVGANNVFHLTALSAGTPRNLTYASNKNGQWNWSAISTVTDAPLTYWAPPYAARWLSLAVDSRNNAHIAFRTSMDLSYDSAGHPRAYSELKYASNVSGQWAIGLVQAPADITAEAANGASIAIAPDDKPRLVSWYNDRGDGGSAAASQMFYHQQDAAGNWTHTMILNAPDGYSAGDGPKGTGFSPYLRFDGSGRPHILFLDHAGEHFSGIGQQEYAGNLRHAWFNGSSWSVETIYRQVSPLDREIVYPAFAIHGSEMAVTLLQRETRWNLTAYPPLSNSTYYFRFFTQKLQ
ncbi:MAG TPA: chitobiase/beta-hexosaminidase C-terminal domain-containing protein [Verrucomicrobiae bacterium]|nr:chitobiase/beta-hexosaminidase C-terminal domain-containing protein [Verrucomicrobiae bacterium]